MLKRGNKKIKLGIFSFTCCEGCTIVLIEALNKKYDQWMKKIAIENFRVLKKVKPIKQLDIALVEGAISTPSEEKRLQEIRKKTKTLIAFGSGATNGYPSNLRNEFSPKLKKQIEPLLKKLKQNKKILPLNKFVKVDDKIDGCPVDEEELIKKIDSLIQNA